MAFQNGSTTCCALGELSGLMNGVNQKIFDQWVLGRWQHPYVPYDYRHNRPGVPPPDAKPTWSNPCSIIIFTAHHVGPTWTTKRGNYGEKLKNIIEELNLGTVQVGVDTHNIRYYNPRHFVTPYLWYVDHTVLKAYGQRLLDEKNLKDAKRKLREEKKAAKRQYKAAAHAAPQINLRDTGDGLFV